MGHVPEIHHASTYQITVINCFILHKPYQEISEETITTLHTKKIHDKPGITYSI